MPVKNLKLSSEKSEFWKTCILHHELNTPQKLITSDEIDDGIKKCDSFLIL